MPSPPMSRKRTALRSRSVRSAATGQASESRSLRKTVFRFTMLPEGVAACGNAVFSFPGKAQAQVLEDESFIYAKTARLGLRFRKLPWEMTVILDGKELTGEQIKDFNVDQRYKSLPCGFALDDDGRVLHTYETMYMHCDESFYGFGEKFTDFNKRG